MAARAQAATGLLASADRALGALDAGRREAVERVLDRMAAAGEGIEGLRRAGELAEGSAGVAADPEWAGSGTAPGTQAVHAGSMAVLAGLTAAIARSGADLPALLGAIDTMKMPVRYNSGGREDDRPHRAVLIEEARAGGDGR